MLSVISSGSTNPAPPPPPPLPPHQTKSRARIGRSPTKPTEKPPQIRLLHQVLPVLVQQPLEVLSRHGDSTHSYKSNAYNWTRHVSMHAMYEYDTIAMSGLPRIVPASPFQNHAQPPNPGPAPNHLIRDENTKGAFGVPSPNLFWALTPLESESESWTH